MERDEPVNCFKRKEKQYKELSLTSIHGVNDKNAELMMVVNMLWALLPMRFTDLSITPHNSPNGQILLFYRCRNWGHTQCKITQARWALIHLAKLSARAYKTLCIFCGEGPWLSGISHRSLGPKVSLDLEQSSFMEVMRFFQEHKAL